ncbi:MAG TPA: EAL domain-containing protein, partial [Thermoleophilia bacterium]|nr:EAL domain-containing protein [Thermoleophilia bacterium]
GEDPLGVLLVGLAAATIGLLLWYLPWDRWPRHASLVVVPVGFALIAARNSVGGVDPYLYPTLFVVAFTWIGVSQRQGTSLLLLPVFVAAYLSPILSMGLATPMSVSSVVYVGLVCVLVGETLAWVSGRLAQTQGALQERRAEERFRALVQNAFDVITIVDAGGVIRYSSPSATRVLGYDLDELTGTRFLDLVHPDDAALAMDVISDLSSRNGECLPAEWRLRHEAGSWRPVEAVGQNLLGDPHVNGLVFTVRDIGERKDLEQQLAHQAFHDALTNLANRALFRERVAHALKRNERDGGSAAVLFIDLDEFKTVNDSLGHSAGDRVLVTVAERLQECVRGADTVARIGGDEFAVLIEDLHSTQDALDAGSRVVARLAAPHRVEATEIVVGASVGVAVSSCGRNSAEEIMRDADAAMYVAKRNGKGRLEVFEPSMHAAAIARLSLESDLRRAIDRGEFSVHYQPILDLTSETVRSLEALVRWNHPQRGLLLPDDFIHVAEETGLIVPMGRLVITEGCRQFRDWRSRGYLDADVTLCINISARQLQDGGLIDALRGALVASQLEAPALVLEITEGMLVQDVPATMKRLTTLKALGFHLAIDDFGTGYSSLSYLQRFPFDILKVDRSFVAVRKPDSETSSLVRAIVALSRALGLQTVAEGIEGLGQLDWLRELDCDFGQGFHFARPMAAEGMTSFLGMKAQHGGEVGTQPPAGRAKRTQARLLGVDAGA